MAAKGQTEVLFLNRVSQFCLVERTGAGQAHLLRFGAFSSFEACPQFRLHLREYSRAGRLSVRFQASCLVSVRESRRIYADIEITFPRFRSRMAVENRGQNSFKTAQLQQAMSGDYLGGRAARRFAGTPLRCLVMGFVVSAASNNCRNRCSNHSTAFPKAPSCPARTTAMDGCKSNDGGRNIFTVSIE